MRIQPDGTDIRTILSSYFYQIPRFQRPYSWEKGHVEEFWRDVIVDAAGEYFIGSIVVYKIKKDRYAIVDGQQRLTTITMILCAVRNFLNEYGFNKEASGANNLIHKSDTEEDKNYPILDSEPDSSYSYLHAHIQKFPSEDVEPKRKEEMLLKQSFDLINNKIRDTVNGIINDSTLSDEKKNKKIKQVLTDIKNSVVDLRTIFIVLDNQDDAYVIFETLNTRGINLAISDMVKTYLLRKLRTKSARLDVAKEKWKEIQRTMEFVNGGDINSFIHHYWLSTYDYTTIVKLFKKLKNEIKTKEKASDLLDDLVTNVKTYKEILEPKTRIWKFEEEKVESSLNAFNIFRIKQILPMILSIMREYREKRIRTKYVIDMLRCIENFHFIFTAVTSQRSSGGISFMYAFHARELLIAEETSKKVGVFKVLKGKLNDKRPNFETFIAEFLEIKFSDNYTKQEKLVRYILQKIDAFNREGIAVDYNQMTIEHLESQNVKKGSKLPEEIIAQLGNLFLVTQELNEKLASKNFDEKKKILLNHPNVWTGEVFKKATKWGKEKIEERTKELAELAYNKVWKL